MRQVNRLINSANYINLIIADFIASLGERMIIPIISSLFIYNIDLSPQMLAIVAIDMAAQEFFGSTIEALVDNRNSVPILIYSDILRTVLSVILHFCAYHYEAVLLRLFLEGRCRCFFLSSMQIALKIMIFSNLLPKESDFLYTSM